ncbi:hypothetical protein LguiA_023076 [Lonicera macranthoides]
MDSDHRTHRTGSNTTTTTSELFICFTSRLSSSSSMKISKSSIHSPSRSRDHPTSLSTSLSRRLRPNGSMKGWQASPMFPTGGNKKRGAGFENPEPSSPKVTCIGQVRVKTKKQRKKMQRRHSGREFSFRKVEVTSQNENENATTQNNQGYQQSICEALRSIGAEFSCLLPCKSSCFSMGEGEKGREIELVVGGGEEVEEEAALPVRNSRRHVFDNLEIEDLMPKVKKDDEVVEEGRVSICVPPKNALLLMRCRSDPIKMADLTNRFWDSSVQDEDDDDEDEYEKDDANVKEFDVIEEGSEKRDSVDASEEEQVKPEAEMELKLEILQDEEVEIANEDLQISEGIAEETKGNNTVVEEENALMDSSFEALADPEVCESSKDNVVEEKEEVNSRKTNSTCSLQHSAEEENEPEEEEEEEEEEESISKKLETQQFEERERKSSPTTVETESERSVLPDCLLLMMCEPKLSMEVSKETWVCSTDFIRHHQPEKKVKQINGGDEPKMEQVVTIDNNSDSNTTQHHQPPRSSCSFPAPVIEEKLASAVGCEPFVLTRCKSAPMRAAAAANSKVGQDSCFWKNRNLEPHRRSSVGFGTAGMGF